MSTHTHKYSSFLFLSRSLSLSLTHASNHVRAPTLPASLPKHVELHVRVGYVLSTFLRVAAFQIVFGGFHQVLLLQRSYSDLGLFEPKDLPG